MITAPFISNTPTRGGELPASNHCQAPSVLPDHQPIPGHHPGQAQADGLLQAQAQADGLLQVSLAPFRGSFNDVLSQAIRVAGQGSRVMIAQFLNGGISQGPQGATRLCGNLEWIRPAIDCCLVDPSTITPHHRQAVQGVWVACRQQLLASDLDLMVLDELGLALEFGLIEEESVVTALQQRPASLDVTLIGSAIPQSILAMANQVTQLRCPSSNWFPNRRQPA